MIKYNQQGIKPSKFTCICIVIHPENDWTEITKY